MEFSIKDTYRAQVEAITGGKNTVMYDDYGNPNIMVEVNTMASGVYGLKTKHVDYPTYVCGPEDNRHREIWIAKYAAGCGDNNSPISKEGVNFWTNISFEEAKAACKRMGKGWHLTSNYEWLQVCYSNMMMRTFKDVPTDKGRFWEPFGMKDTTSFKDMRTGMFGSKYSSTGDIDGVMDMAGTVWQWIDGLKIGPNWEQLYYWGIDGEPYNMVNGDEQYTTYKNICLDAEPTSVDGPTNSNRSNIHIDNDRTSSGRAGLNLGGMPTAIFSANCKSDEANYANVSRLIGVMRLDNTFIPKADGDPYLEYVPIRNNKEQNAVRGASLYAWCSYKLPSNPLTLSFCTRNRELDTGFRFSYIGEVTI